MPTKRHQHERCTQKIYRRICGKKRKNIETYITYLTQIIITDCYYICVKILSETKKGEKEHKRYCIFFKKKFYFNCCRVAPIILFF